MDMIAQIIDSRTVAAIDGVTIRRANPYEITQVLSFVASEFSQSWADECLPCFSRQPVTLYLATREGKVIGFGAYEATRRAFFGPTGVKHSERGKGIGKALLNASLNGLRELGYAYAIIGGVSDAAGFYEAAGASAIPNSDVGVYGDRLL